MIQDICYLRTGWWAMVLFSLFIWWKVKGLKIYRIVLVFFATLFYNNYQNVHLFSLVIFWNIIYYSLRACLVEIRYFTLDVWVQFVFSIYYLLTYIILWLWFWRDSLFLTFVQNHLIVYIHFIFVALNNLMKVFDIF